ncbi:MAG TPA: cytochrome c biogenesis protein DipZ [Pseudonocardiaceae bacterium]|nr:cytochrome c biogenesis protein DipZ [Pseudonocardiaceae bacterium]
MITLIVIGFLAGVITSISPCVLPVLPVILTAGASRRTPVAVPAGGMAPAPDDDEEAERPRTFSWRPIGVVVGLVISFSLATLFGSVVLSALHLPQDLLRDLGIAVLAIIGVSLIWPWFGELLERPFARLPSRQVNPNSNGIVLGLGLGLLYVPCAGPVLATIAVVGATHDVGFGALVLTAAFGIGAGVPLLILALAGEAITRRTGALRTHARQLRFTGGVLMLVVAVAIGFNLTDGLQRNVPGYTTALQNLVEGNSGASNQLQQVRANTGNGPGKVSAAGSGAGAGPTSTQCTEDGQVLERCGTAPDFAGITGWLNTPGDKPLDLASLRGKTVLIDFWTYSCINCQRSLPHLEAWYKSYAADGLVIVGVHTPEFAFEHVMSNIQAQSKALGVNYPVAVDDNDATWNAYSNQYWPAEYLIDPTGQVRHINFGEGGYGTTEQLIRELLLDHDHTLTLPKATDVPDKTPTETQSPETYLGYQYAPLHITGQNPVQNAASTTKLPATVTQDTFALGGTWTSEAEDLSAGPGAALELNFQAKDVYLVLGGHGTVTVQLGGKTTQTFTVASVPKLYTLVSSPNSQRGLLRLDMSPGVQAYDFTFG